MIIKKDTKNSECIRKKKDFLIIGTMTAILIKISPRDEKKNCNKFLISIEL